MCTKTSLKAIKSSIKPKIDFNSKSLKANHKLVVSKIITFLQEEAFLLQKSSRIVEFLCQNVFKNFAKKLISKVILKLSSKFK